MQVFSILAILAAFILLAHALGIVLCPLKRFTGVPCPTCGSTRALVCVLHGDFAHAFVFQPLVMTLVLAAGPVVLAAMLSPRAKRLFQAMLHHPLTWILAGLSIAANWVYVILHGN